MGAPLQSPDGGAEPGVARPSQLLGDGANAGGSSSPDEDSTQQNRQVSQALVRTKDLMDKLEQLATTYPAAAPEIRKAVSAIKDAAKKIVATGSGGQENPSPRMLG